MLVLDIETIKSKNLNQMELDKIDSFETDKEKNEYIDLLPLNPFASEIFCLGLKDTDTQKKWILVHLDTEDEFKSEDENTKYVFFKTEKQLLESFWEWIAKYSDKRKSFKYLTFNGRDFDMPYIILKSAVLGVQPTVNLMYGTEYNYDNYHIDLAKKLTFMKWGGTQGPLHRKKLDYYLRAFGIESSKTEDVCGGMVSLLHGQGRYKDIVEYNVGDLDKTEELFNRTKEYLFIN